MTDKITKALETVNELHGETLKKLDDGKTYAYLSPIKTEGGVYSDDPTFQKIIEERDALKAEVAKYKAIASKAIREQIDVRKDERERCALICERLRHPHGWSEENDDWCDATKDCAAAIREGSDD